MITLTLSPAVFQILFKESNALFREIKNGHYLILIKPFEERAICLSIYLNWFFTLNALIC